VEHHSGRISLASRIIFGVVVLAFLGFVILDWKESKEVLVGTNWHYVPPVLGLTFLSYVCASLGFVLVGEAFGLKVRRFSLFRVGIITMAVNNLVSMGGVAGHTIRVALLRNRDAAGGEILAASIFHSYLYTLSVTAGLPASLVYLYTSRPFSVAESAGLAAGFLLSIAIFVTMSLLVFSRRVRVRVFDLVCRAAARLFRKDLHDAFGRFHTSLSGGVRGFRKGRWLLVTLLIAGDWMFCILALFFCFRAFGISLRPGVLVMGFFAGISMGIVSMIPGGLGVQEGSMAGMYHLFGLSFEGALLSTILFRILYYLVPAAIGVVIYWHYLHAESGRQDPSAAQREPA
jgi:uncharacterized protein (TIRG00374 family)